MTNEISHKKPGKASEAFKALSGAMSKEAIARMREHLIEELYEDKRELQADLSVCEERFSTLTAEKKSLMDENAELRFLLNEWLTSWENSIAPEERIPLARTKEVLKK